MAGRIDFEKFCDDCNVPMAPEGHKHSRPGWIQVECPFCTGNPGYHLGFNEQNNYFHCWRCGWKGAVPVLMKLGNLGNAEARHVLAKYLGRPTKETKPTRHEAASHCTFPPGTGKMWDKHKRYLRKRNFKPNKLRREWDLRGTGNWGPYKFRIIAPIYQGETLVSYQGRDYTDKQELKYKACKKENEVVHHKETLYGLDKAEGRASVVVVEGITDVWRLGPGVVATFGIEYTPAQVITLAQFERVQIMFDPADKQAWKQAIKLGTEVGALGASVETIKFDGEGDPADLSQDDADELMEELRRK